MLRPELAQKLATLAEVVDRFPQPLSVNQQEWAA
jgi:hypothetical protein